MVHNPGQKVFKNQRTRDKNGQCERTYSRSEIPVGCPKEFQIPRGHIAVQDSEEGQDDHYGRVDIGTPHSVCKSEDDGDEQSEEHGDQLSSSPHKAGQNVGEGWRPKHISVHFFPSYLVWIHFAHLFSSETSLLWVIVRTVWVVGSVLATLIRLYLVFENANIVLADSSLHYFADDH